MKSRLPQRSRPSDLEESAFARMQPGKKHFLVRHNGKNEEIVVDLKEAQAGWTLIGGFQLDAGENRIEMTDRNEERFVLADAVKWVIQK